MCFSAEASFIVGGSLFVIGSYTIKKAHHRRDLPIALIPMIFSLQQITEGMLWLVLEHNNLPDAQLWLATVYGIFIGVIWPTFAPYALYNAETNRLRRNIIFSIGIIGLGLAIYTVIGLFKQPIVAEIINHSIYYKHDVDGSQIVTVLYLLATCVPFIFSSYRHLSIAGIVITMGFFIAYWTYTETFASVWCFYAAIASAFICLYFYHKVKKPLIPLP